VNDAPVFPTAERFSPPEWKTHSFWWRLSWIWEMVTCRWPTRSLAVMMPPSLVDLSLEKEVRGFGNDVRGFGTLPRYDVAVDRWVRTVIVLKLE